MSRYKRFTRECRLEQLKPALLDAVRKHLAARGLADEEAQVVMCCETVSERQPATGLSALVKEDADEIYYTGALFTPQWLVWARSSEKSGTAVVSARLKEIRVKPFASLLVSDTGLEVMGDVGDPGARVSGYIGLGAEAAAHKFCEAVKRAVDKANPPRSLLDVFTIRGK